MINMDVRQFQVIFAFFFAQNCLVSTLNFIGMQNYCRDLTVKRAKA